MKRILIVLSFLLVLATSARAQQAVKSDTLYIVDGDPWTKAIRTEKEIRFSRIGVNKKLEELVVSKGGIKSKEILKPTDATAIYGSRGANGVVKITTTGKKD